MDGDRMHGYPSLTASVSFSMIYGSSQWQTQAGAEVPLPSVRPWVPRSMTNHRPLGRNCGLKVEEKYGHVAIDHFVYAFLLVINLI